MRLGVTELEARRRCSTSLDKWDRNATERSILLFYFLFFAIAVVDVCGWGVGTVCNGIEMTGDSANTHTHNRQKI